jgi:hypothetical protein
LRKVAAVAAAPVVEAPALGEPEVRPQAVHRRAERLADRRPEREVPWVHQMPAQLARAPPA